MSGIEIVWNTFSSTDIPEVVFSNPVRQLLGPTRGTFQTIPGKKGSWYYPEFRDRRKITVPGFILADSYPTSRRDIIGEFADWLDVDIEARLILGDSPDVYYEAVLGDCGDINEWRELGQFELEWLVQPYSFALTTTLISLSATNSYTTTFDPDLLTIVYPVIEITPTNGTITGFVLAMNDDSFLYQGALGFTGLVNSGSTLTIDCETGVVYSGAVYDSELTGAYDPDLLQMFWSIGRFPLHSTKYQHLLPGHQRHSNSNNRPHSLPQGLQEVTQ
jgi:predicted phage tail component-like protein